MSLVEREYQNQIDAMSVAEKMQRSMAMLKWAREMIARDIQEQRPAISPEHLKWEVALQQFQSEPHICELIEGILDRVPA